MLQTTGVPEQTPAWQVAPVVHRLLSLHVPPCGTGAEHWPVAAWQVPGALH